MKKENGKNGIWALCLLAAFVLWTLLVKYVDVSSIGPLDSRVGFSTLNGWFHSLTGVHMGLYVLTDWLGLVPVAFGLGFAVLGLVQWVQRKNIRKVDDSILALGIFYILVTGTYIFFEEVVINYRPVLIEGFLEASYPSSTTLLVLCVMPTSRMQLRGRIRNIRFRRGICGILVAFEVLMVTGRLISGVHWLTDILGGVLLSSGLVRLYVAISGGKEYIDDRKLYLPTGDCGGDPGGV